MTFLHEKLIFCERIICKICIKKTFAKSLFLLLVSRANPFLVYLQNDFYAAVEIMYFHLIESI